MIINDDTLNQYSTELFSMVWHASVFKLPLGLALAACDG